MSKTLKQMHDEAYASIDRYDNYNYDNEVIHWHPVAKDKEFEKHIAKLKAMKKFNEGK